MRTGVLVPETRGRLPGGQQGIPESVGAGLCSRSHQVPGDPGRRARSSLQRFPDRQVEYGPVSLAESVEDGLAVQVVAERAPGDDTRPAGLVQKAPGRRLTGRDSVLHQQAEVNIAARDGRPFQQPHAFGGQPGQPPAQRLRDPGWTGLAGSTSPA